MDAKMKKKWRKVYVFKISLFKYSLNMIDTINYVLFFNWLNCFVNQFLVAIWYDAY